MRRFTSLASAVLMLLCLGANAQTKVTFIPHWIPQAQFIGYYVAQQKGFYKDEGLDVTIKHPTESHSSYDSFTEGECQFTTTFLTAALAAYDKGVKLRNVMQTSQGSTQMIISRTPINSLSDLKGKKIARWSIGFNTLAQIVDKELGIGIQWIPTNWSVGLYKSGAIDGTMAQSYNEYYQLLASGETISKDQVRYLRDLGFNVPEDGLYVLESYLEENPETVEKFVRASKKGWKWARENRKEALDIIMGIVNEYGLPTNPWLQEKMLSVILDSAFEGEGDLALSPRHLTLRTWS